MLINTVIIRMVAVTIGLLSMYYMSSEEFTTIELIVYLYLSHLLFPITDSLTKK